MPILLMLVICRPVKAFGLAVEGADFRRMTRKMSFSSEKPRGHKLQIILGADLRSGCLDKLLPRLRILPRMITAQAEILAL